MGGRYEIHDGDGYKNWNKSSNSVLIDHSSRKKINSSESLNIINTVKVKTKSMFNRIITRHRPYSL